MEEFPEIEEESYNVEEETEKYGIELRVVREDEYYRLKNVLTEGGKPTSVYHDDGGINDSGYKTVDELKATALEAFSKPVVVLEVREE